LVFLLLAVMLAPGYLARVAKAASACVSSLPPTGAYTVSICLTAPADGATLAGGVAVTATVAVTGTNPGVQRMVFYLSGAYLLTDYQSPYSFNLPTTRWVDGTYSIEVEALMRDAFITQRAGANVVFHNNISTPPVNTRQFTPTAGTAPAPGAPFVVMATGDGASGEANMNSVVNLIAAANPNLFLYLGDVYEKGTPVEFDNWYGKAGANYGRFRSITNPTIGNHEYEVGVAPGYFDYWDNTPNYYSFNAGSWHFISLNANSDIISAASGSAQYNWLRDDLAANTDACTIVYYHQPFFNVGPEGPLLELADIWALMARYHVTMVLNGHDHDYQRWVPLDGNGNPNPGGITEFVAGGGGHGVQTISGSDSRVASSNSQNPDALGALKLSLSPGMASFTYLSITGAALDSGTVPCANPSADILPPSTPAGFTAAATLNKVDLTWKAATDNNGVSGYSIYRDGALLASLTGKVTSYRDLAVKPRIIYSYTIDAFDKVGNHSALSSLVVVITSAIKLYLPSIKK
jgi:hypothetical protein